MVNPFQFTLGFKNAIANGIKSAASMFKGALGSAITNVENKVNNLSDSMDKMLGIAQGAQKMLKGALVFAGVSLAVGELTDNIKKFDQEFSNLVMITGSTSQSHALGDWFDDVTSKVAVSRDELVDLTKVARKYNATVNDLDVGGLVATAKVTGQSLAGLTENIAGMTQTMKLSYQEAVAKSIELTGTTKNADKILKAFNSTAFNSEDRFKALAGVMANVVPPDMRLASTSLGDMSQMIGSIMSSFGRAFAGDPMKSGPIYEIRMAVGGLLKFLQENMNTIKAVFTGIGKVIGSVIKFIVDIAGKMMKKLGDLFQGMKMSTQDFNKNVIMPFITFLEIIKAKVMGWIDAFTDGLSAGFSGMWESISPYIDEIRKALGPLIDMLGFGSDQGKVKGIWNDIGNFIGSTLNVIIQLSLRLISKIMPAVIKTFQVVGSSLGKIFESIQRVWDKLVFAFTGGTGKSSDAMKNLEKIIDVIATLIISNVEVLATSIGIAVDIIISTFETMWTVLSNIVVVIKKLFKGDFAGAFKVIIETVDTVWKHIKFVFGKIVDLITNSVGKSFETLGKVWDAFFGDDENKNVTVGTENSGAGYSAVTESNPSLAAMKSATKNVKQQTPLNNKVTVPVSVQISGKEIARANAEAVYKQEYR